MRLHKVKQVVSNDKNWNTTKKNSFEFINDKQELFVSLYSKKTGQILEIEPIESSNILKVLPTPSIKIRIMEFQLDVLLTPYDIAPGVQSYNVFKYL